MPVGLVTMIAALTYLGIDPAQFADVPIEPVLGHGDVVGELRVIPLA